MKGLCAGIAVCLGLSVAGSASASLITYTVNMNFDPGAEDGGTGPGTITGTFTIDTSDLDLVNIDLTEATNNGDTFGGAFGTQTFTTLTYGNSSISSAATGQVNYKFGGDPYLFVSVQSPCCDVDGVEVGPGFQFDFAYPQGGSVQAGNFDSTTFESNFLYGTVTPAVAAVPEPDSWVMLISGLSLAGVALRRRRADQSGPPRR